MAFASNLPRVGFCLQAAMDRIWAAAYAMALYMGCGEMIRFLIRLLAILILAGGFASLVIDGTRSIAGNELLITPAADLLRSRLPALEQGVSRNIHPLLWDPVLLAVLRLPAWLALALIGLLLLRFAARRRNVGRPARL